MSPHSALLMNLQRKCHLFVLFHIDSYNWSEMTCLQVYIFEWQLDKISISKWVLMIEILRRFENKDD